VDEDDLVTVERREQEAADRAAVAAQTHKLAAAELVAARAAEEVAAATAAARAAAAEVAALREAGADRHDHNGRGRVLRDADAEAHAGARRDAGGSGVRGFNRNADWCGFTDGLDFKRPRDA
jgi:hypothetical protein